MENLHQFPAQESLVNELADQIAALLNKGIQKNGRAGMAVSGGSTPIPLFERLSEIEFPWERVIISLVDERWVEADEKDSNEGLVRRHLLKKRAAKANFIGMKNKAATASEGETACERQIQKLPRPFDVLILGMGGDGHTASLFPGAEKLGPATAMDSGRACIAIAPLTAPHERMSLTLPRILDSRKIFLHIIGKDKKAVLEKAMLPGPQEKMPIRFILQQQRSQLDIYWAL